MTPRYPLSRAAEIHLIRWPGNWGPLQDFFGVRHFWLTDSNFTTNLNHVQRVCEAIIDADLGCRFTALSRVDIGRHRELLQLMRRAGFVTLSIGMEALRDDQLAELDKYQTVDNIIETIGELHRAEMTVFGLFMVGFDEDTAKTPFQIVDFCRKHQVDGVSIYCLTEYPALPGRTLPRYRICEPNLDYHSGHFVVTFPKQARPSELERAVFDALCGFYSPGAIASALWNGRRDAAGFLGALYHQMRRMRRVSRKHRQYLRRVERPYYDGAGILLEDELRRAPIVDWPLSAETLAGWPDAAEPITSDLPLATSR